MKKKDIIKAVQDIKYSAGDDEPAHSMEDALRESFIEHIATLKMVNYYRVRFVEVKLKWKTLKMGRVLWGFM